MASASPPPLTYALRHANGRVEAVFDGRTLIVRTEGVGLADRLRESRVPIAALSAFAVVPTIGAQHLVPTGRARAESDGSRLAGRVTMPLLRADGCVLMGSDEIAKYAEVHASGPPLFPVVHEEAVSSWMDRSEALMVSGRAMLLSRLSANAPALREQLPKGVPSMMRSAFGWVAALGVKHLVAKYGIRANESALHEATSRQTLLSVRAALGAGRGNLVGDGFSYADVTIAAALQFVRPVSDRYIRLGPATR